MSFGLILTMGIVQLSDMKDYWSRHETLNLSFVQIIPKDKKREYYHINILFVGRSCHETGFAAVPEPAPVPSTYPAV